MRLYHFFNHKSHLNIVHCKTAMLPLLSILLFFSASVKTYAIGITYFESWSAESTNLQWKDLSDGSGSSTTKISFIANEGDVFSFSYNVNLDSYASNDPWYDFFAISSDAEPYSNPIFKQTKTGNGSFSYVFTSSGFVNLTLKYFKGRATKYTGFAHIYDIKLTRAYCDESGNVYSLFPDYNASVYKIINFEDGDRIKETLENGTYIVSEINSKAFENQRDIHSLTIPHTIKKIKANAFEGCVNLEKVSFAPSVDTLRIESSSPLFQDSQLKTIDIKRPIEYKISPFANNSFVEKINISSCKTVGPSLCDGCTNLSVVNIEGVSKINTSAFSGCSRLSNFNDLTLQLDTIEGYAFYGCGNLGKITLGENISYIGTNAFKDCASLIIYTEAKEPLYQIERYIDAFKDLKDKTLYVLEENLPYYKTSKEWNQFGKIYSIDGDNYDPVIPTLYYNDNSNYDFEVDGIYYAVESLEQLTCKVVPSKYSGKISIPSHVDYKNRRFTVTAISSGAFINCGELISIQLPKTISYIYPGAFSGCSGLKNVHIEDGVTAIGNSAFYGCKSLSEIAIPSTLVSIGEHAFENCTSLKEIDIPNSVKIMGESAFAGCTSLVNIKLSEHLEAIPAMCFYKCPLKNVRIPLGVYIIKSSAFSSCSIESLTISSSVMIVDEFAFQYCSALKELILEDGKFTIGMRCNSQGGHHGAFWDSKLTSVYLGRNCKNEGNNINYYDTKVFWDPFNVVHTFPDRVPITKLVIGDNVTTYICETTRTEELVIGKNLQIGNSFMHSEKLRKI